jgi:hypothetical protein
MLVTEDHPRQRFPFDVQHGVTLDLRKIPDLGLGKSNVREVPLAQL